MNDNEKIALLSKCLEDLEAVISATKLGATVVAIENEICPGFSVVLDGVVIGGVRVEHRGDTYGWRHLPADEPYTEEWLQSTRLYVTHGGVIQMIFERYYANLIHGALYGYDEFED